MPQNMTPASIDSVGVDENRHPLLGGVNDGARTQVCTALMEPDGVDPELGAVHVHIASGSTTTTIAPPGPGVAGHNTLVASTAERLVAATRPCVSVCVRNHDGANPNGNTDMVYVGFDNTVSAANGFPIEPGAGVTIPIDDATDVWIYSTGTPTVSYLIT